MLSSALGFAGKAKRGGQEVEVAGKDVALLRPQHEEEAKAEEGGPPKDDDELLGGGKKMPVLTAMQKRWITHFRGRPRLLAYLLLLFATGAMLMLAGLWTQCFFPSVFNSRLAQELVLNAEDKWSGHWTYQVSNWALTSLSSLYWEDRGGGRRLTLSLCVLAAVVSGGLGVPHVPAVLGVPVQRDQPGAGLGRLQAHRAGGGPIRLRQVGQQLHRTRRVLASQTP